ncbi:MAG: phenylalanine--tRNA ligase subunit beta, partial [Dehalococcoidales bacterium]|nr:phenylalanine--tRNA ligase subunit beta [Dehalococcoidales bacterium]
ALAANRRHEDGGIRLFELGRVYRPREGDLPEDTEMLCGIMSGPRTERSWLGADSNMDFYDAKGMVEGLFSALGLEVDFTPGHDEGLHPARQAKVILRQDGGEVEIGVVGELHPKIADAFEIAGPVGIFEINIATLLKHGSGEKKFQPIPRFPGSIRDIAIVVDASVTNREAVNIIRRFSLVSRVSLFDVYTGKQVPPGKKSLAYRIVYQSPSRTLTDEEVNRVQEAILERLSKELGATLRAQ